MKRNSAIVRLAVLGLTAVLALATSCGYSAAGRASRLPPNVNTVAIPAFINQTQSYRIEQAMTTAVVEEFITRTKLRVVHEPEAEADAVLKGTVVSAQAAPLTYDSRTGRASSALVTVRMQVSLLGRDGKVIFENPNYIFREQYQVSREVSSFFEEESPAVERMARDFARTLVADVLEAW